MGIVVGDKAEWSKGYGAHTVRMVLHYAFEELELNRVELTTDEENHRAIRCYEKCGFVREGTAAPAPVRGWRVREHARHGRASGGVAWTLETSYDGQTGVRREPIAPAR